MLSAMINHHFRKQFLCSIQLYQMQPMGVITKRKTMHLAFSGWYRIHLWFWYDALSFLPSSSPPPLCSHCSRRVERRLGKCLVAVLVFPIEGLCRSSQRLHPAHTQSFRREASKVSGRGKIKSSYSLSFHLFSLLSYRSKKESDTCSC